MFYDVIGKTAQVLAVVHTSEVDAWPPAGREGRRRDNSHGKPTGILIGFESGDDWFDYRLEHDLRFLRRGEVAWTSSKLLPTAGYGER